jgi:hypothetical protein
MFDPPPSPRRKMIQELINEDYVYRIKTQLDLNFSNEDPILFMDQNCK